MKVRIKKTNEKAVVPYKNYAEDFCYDVVATSEEEIAPNVWKYGIGLAFEIDGKRWLKVIEYPMQERFKLLAEAVFSIDFRPRSSIWKTGMVLSNSVGTIDDLYRGEVSAVFYHVFPNMPRYKVGERSGGIELGCGLPSGFEEVEEVSVTGRGGGG